LQEKFDDLSDNCKKAIGNFTEEEGEVCDLFSLISVHILLLAVKTNRRMTYLTNKRMQQTIRCGRCANLIIASLCGLRFLSTEELPCTA